MISMFLPYFIGEYYRNIMLSEKNYHSQGDFSGPGKRSINQKKKLKYL